MMFYTTTDSANDLFWRKLHYLTQNNKSQYKEFARVISCLAAGKIENFQAHYLPLQLLVSSHNYFHNVKSQKSSN